MLNNTMNKFDKFSELNFDNLVNNQNILQKSQHYKVNNYYNCYYNK